MLEEMSQMKRSPTKYVNDICQRFPQISSADVSTMCVHLIS